MKKFLICICLLLLLFVLTACDPNEFYFDYAELKEKVVRVEYILYDNPNAVKLDEFLVKKSDKLLPFDFDKMEVREVLHEEKMDNFFKELSEYPILMDWIHMDSPQGDCIRIIYDNGDFEILCCTQEKSWKGYYSGAFYANGEVKRFIGWGIDREFFLKWFDI